MGKQTKKATNGSSQNFVKGAERWKSPTGVHGQSPSGDLGLCPQKLEITFKNITEEIDENIQIMK